MANLAPTRSVARSAVRATMSAMEAQEYLAAGKYANARESLDNAREQLFTAVHCLGSALEVLRQDERANTREADGDPRGRP